MKRSLPLLCAAIIMVLAMSLFRVQAQVNGAPSSSGVRSDGSVGIPDAPAFLLNAEAVIVADPLIGELLDPPVPPPDANNQEQLLLTQAQNFLDQGDYPRAQMIAYHVLTTINKDSLPAQQILSTAQNKLSDLTTQRAQVVETNK